MVSLCDLRSADEADIDFALKAYFFLNPRGMKGPNPVFLLLSDEAQKSVLSPHDVARRFPDGGRFVPRIEGAFPGRIDLSLVATALLVSVAYEPLTGPGGEHLKALLRSGSVSQIRDNLD
jgi:hypothetical protein